MDEYYKNSNLRLYSHNFNETSLYKLEHGKLYFVFIPRKHSRTEVLCQEMRYNKDRNWFALESDEDTSYYNLLLLDKIDYPITWIPVENVSNFIYKESSLPNHYVLLLLHDGKENGKECYTEILNNFNQLKKLTNKTYSLNDKFSEYSFTLQENQSTSCSLSNMDCLVYYKNNLIVNVDENNVVKCDFELNFLKELEYAINVRISELLRRNKTK